MNKILNLIQFSCTVKQNLLLMHDAITDICMSLFKESGSATELYVTQNKNGLAVVVSRLKINSF